MLILVMAFGNAGFAQPYNDLKSRVTEQILKQYGLVRESYVVPQQANYNVLEGAQYRTTYYYDEYEYTLTEEITEVYLDDWKNEARITYDYGFNSNVLEMYHQMWVGSDWMDVMRATFDYDGDVVSEVIYQFNMGGSWVNQTKEVYNYNGDQWTMLTWNWNGNNWSSDHLYTYTRVSNVIELLVQYMEGGAWQNEAEEICTLDFDENVVEILYREWNTGSLLWEDVERMTYVYEDGVYTDQYVQVWDGATWKDEYYYTFGYDEIGNAKHGVCFEYDGETWVPANGNIDMAYGFNADTKSFYGSEVDMVYVDLTNVNENTQAVNFLVYPVPAKEVIYIEAEGFQKAEIYSLTGQKLMESLSDRMDVGELSSGLYIIKVYDHEGNCATQRFVVK